MRLHTNTIDRATILRTLAETVPAAWADTLRDHGSRSHARAYEIRLHAESGTDANGKKRRPPNSGGRGADGTSVKAPTYDEWGVFIARLFDVDPDATFGPYKGRDGFHDMTHGAYLPTLASSGIGSVRAE